jgi:hypothetical protein
MPRLYDQSNDQLLGRISQEDLALLMAQLGKESSRERGYHVDNDTFLALVDAGASSHLLDALKNALDLSGEADIRWLAD